MTQQRFNKKANINRINEIQNNMFMIFKEANGATVPQVQWYTKLLLGNHSIPIGNKILGVSLNKVAPPFEVILKTYNSNEYTTCNEHVSHFQPVSEKVSSL